MKGRLHKTEDCGWIVLFDDEFLQLHPDDACELIDLNNIFDNIEARILAHPDIEFNIVEHQKMDGVAKYAKLITKNYE